MGAWTSTILHDLEHCIVDLEDLISATAHKTRKQLTYSDPSKGYSVVFDLDEGKRSLKGVRTVAKLRHGEKQKVPFALRDVLDKIMAQQPQPPPLAQPSQSQSRRPRVRTVPPPSQHQARPPFRSFATSASPTTSGPSSYSPLVAAPSSSPYLANFDEHPQDEENDNDQDSTSPSPSLSEDDEEEELLDIPHVLGPHDFTVLSHERQRQRRTHKRTILAIIVGTVLLVAAIIGVALAVALGKNTNSKNTTGAPPSSNTTTSHFSPKINSTNSTTVCKEPLEKIVVFITLEATDPTAIKALDLKWFSDEFQKAYWSLLDSNNNSTAGTNDSCKPRVVLVSTRTKRQGRTTPGRRYLHQREQHGEMSAHNNITQQLTAYWSLLGLQDESDAAVTWKPHTATEPRPKRRKRNGEPYNGSLRHKMELLLRPGNDDGQYKPHVGTTTTPAQAQRRQRYLQEQQSVAVDDDDVTTEATWSSSSSPSALPPWYEQDNDASTERSPWSSSSSPSSSSSSAAAAAAAGWYENSNNDATTEALPPWYESQEERASSNNEATALPTSLPASPSSLWHQNSNNDGSTSSAAASFETSSTKNTESSNSDATSKDAVWYENINNDASTQTVWYVNSMNTSNANDSATPTPSPTPTPTVTTTTTTTIALEVHARPSDVQQLSTFPSMQDHVLDLINMKLLKRQGGNITVFGMQVLANSNSTSGRTNDTTISMKCQQVLQEFNCTPFSMVLAHYELDDWNKSTTTSTNIFARNGTEENATMAPSKSSSPSCWRVLQNSTAFWDQCSAFLDLPKVNNCSQRAKEWLDYTPQLDYNATGNSTTTMSPTQYKQRYVLAILYCEMHGFELTWEDAYYNATSNSTTTNSTKSSDQQSRKRSWFAQTHECQWLDAPPGLVSPCNENNELLILRYDPQARFFSDVHAQTPWTFPSELGLLQSLSELSLPNTQLFGVLSTEEMANLTQLHTLDLSFNDLEGELPNSLWQLSDLVLLRLNDNPSLEGRLPEALPSNLQYLHLGNMNLDGTLPAMSLSKLQWRDLELDHNRFVGPIPSTLFENTVATNLRVVRLNGNELSGQLTDTLIDSLQNATSLEVLTLSDNDNLHGDVNALCQLFETGSLKLFSVDLDSVTCDCCAGDLFNSSSDSDGHDNVTVAENSTEAPFVREDNVTDGTNGHSNNTANFDGASDYFGKFNDLVSFDVVTTALNPHVQGDCNFAGLSQPHVLSQCECMGAIDVVAEDIAGVYNLLLTKFWGPVFGTLQTQLPMTSCDPRNQALIWLSSGNTRQGGDLFQRYVLSVLYIAMNGTSWDQSNLWLSDINECNWFGLQCNENAQLNTIALDTNNLNGKIVDEISMLRKLGGISISRSHVIGNIPATIFALPNLKELNLNANTLSGSLPTSVASGNMLEILRLENNQMTGVLLSEIGMMTNLRELDVSYNDFQGNLPTELGLCTKLTSLMLESNPVVGTIPSELGALTLLESLQLEQTSLTGKMPSEICALREQRSLERLVSDCPTESGGVECEIPACCTTCQTDGGPARARIFTVGRLPDPGA